MLRTREVESEGDDMFQKRMLLGLGLILVLGTFHQVHAKSVDVIAFGSCATQDEPQPIWTSIRKENPDVFIFLGDNIYGDTVDMDVLQKKYDKLGAIQEYKRLKKQTKVIATWDDHDYGMDDSGREYPKKEEAKAIFLDFFDEPKKSERRDRPGIYNSYMFGKEGQRVQVILLDLRWFRSPILKGDWPAKGTGSGPYKPHVDGTGEMMGETQWAWLEEELKKPADLRVIGSSVQFNANFHGWEAWENFPHERRRMMNLIGANKANGVIFISGDMHYGEISVDRRGAAYPLYEVTASGMNRAWLRPEPNQRRMGEQIYYHHYGIIRIDWDLRFVWMEIRDAGNAVRMRHGVPLSDLK